MKSQEEKREAVEEAEDLPDDLDDRPRVKELQSRNTPIVEVSLSGQMSEKKLRKLSLNLETEILDLDGVASVARKGMRDREIWVEVDPAEMARYEIALPQVMKALAERNVNIPGGLLKGRSTELILRTSGELDTAEDVRSVIIRANEEGNWVRVADIAAVNDQFEELKILQRTDGSRGPSGPPRDEPELRSNRRRRCLLFRRRIRRVQGQPADRVHRRYQRPTMVADL